MNALTSLYQLAEDRNITVDCFGLKTMPCMSIVDETGAHIAIDPWQLKSESDELLKLAHELGHCETGAYYGRYSPFAVRQQQEERAWRWACQRLLPLAVLEEAYQAGYKTYWELAEYLNLPEAFIRKAVEFYRIRA